MRSKHATPTSRQLWLAILASALLLLLSGCSPSDEAASDESEATPSVSRTDRNPLRNAYFGDLHVHTQFSFDAYIFDVRATPDDAYRYAKGEALVHPSGYEFQLESGPLDFQAVTDHGSYLGMLPAMSDENDPLYSSSQATELRALDSVDGFRRVLEMIGTGELLELDSAHATRNAWGAIVEAAEQHNDPGSFTTFVGYEYTSSNDGQFNNLHRNVIFRDQAADLPFAASRSQNPEDLWQWMDEQRAQGIEALAIPHNSNGSGGQMFKLETYNGEPLDADYADQRMRNEPLVEVTQVKGDSETHPMLSPNDEWADFETYPYKIATVIESEPDSSYVRQAYRRGLGLQETEGFNPFRFGLIGSTDSHNAGGTPEEWNHKGKVGSRDGVAENRASVPRENGEYQDTSSFRYFGAAGLAGVWAEENTRESLYDAMRRKETFATTGPRIRVRFFAGFDFADDLVSDNNMVETAYATGVPMGGDLLGSENKAPSFLVWASRDARSAPLQRLQIVKAWSDPDGKTGEAVFDVACSDGTTPNAETHRCPDNGATVDLTDCSFSTDTGAGELRTQWSDPSFDPAHRSMYYVRVLENPTCRWSTWDAIRAGTEPNPELPLTIQERAYSSPIWYSP